MSPHLPARGQKVITQAIVLQSHAFQSLYCAYDTGHGVFQNTQVSLRTFTRALWPTPSMMSKLLQLVESRSFVKITVCLRRITKNTLSISSDQFLSLSSPSSVSSPLPMPHSSLPRHLPAAQLCRAMLYTQAAFPALRWKSLSRSAWDWQVGNLMPESMHQSSYSNYCIYHISWQIHLTF